MSDLFKKMMQKKGSMMQEDPYDDYDENEDIEENDTV